jgi:hypothetical protein
MAGISRLPEELRLEILALLMADHDALFSLYNTSFTFRSYLVVYLLKRHPPLLISWAAKNGHFRLLQKVVDEFPEAILDGPCPRLTGLCPRHALVAAARRGHTKVVEIILTFDTNHLAGPALCEAAKEGHADVVSVMLKTFKGHHSPWFHDALSYAIRRGHVEAKKVFREYGNPDCHYCCTNLNLTARKGEKGGKGRSSVEHRLLNRTWAQTLL